MEKEQDIVTVNQSVKKRGSKSASIEHNNTASPEEMKQLIGNVLYWYDRKIVQNDDECAERLNEYFSRINETGEIPTVEKMCLALGTVRSVVWDWEHGSKGPARANMIKRAKEILAGLDAELVQSGKIPVVSYIFRAKNFHNMTDQQQITIEPKTISNISPDEIIDKYQELPE